MKKTLFLSALLSMLPHLHAAVGDTLNLIVDSSYSPNGFMADGAKGSGSYFFGGSYFNADIKTTTRFYDSTKNWSEIIQNSAGDSKMCWAHTAGNMLQYWLSYYGVFYKGNYGELPYGTDYTRTVNPSLGASYTMTDPMRLNTTKHLITVGFNLSNTGGNVYAGIDYFFCRNQSRGGYFSEYFGAFGNGVSIPSGQTSTVTVVNSQDNLTPALLSAMGITKQSDGTYKQTEAGLIAHLNVGADAGNSFSAHTLTCYGLTLDENGNVKSIIYADSDNSKLRGIASSENEGNESMGGIPSIEQAYVKVEGGKVLLYTDAACETPLTYGTDYHYYLGAVTQINTPQVLKNMLAEYSDVDNEAQVWNGESNVWTAQTATTEELPTADTGWDIHVNGSNIDTEHQGYYHTYATEGRAVLFDDHAAADKRTVTINGTVSASSIEVAAAGYTFQAGNNATIQAGADLTLRSAASLHSELELQLNNLTLENEAALAASTTITVKGNFLVTLQQSTTISLLTAAAPGVSIDAALNLSEASSVSIEATVDMNSYTLTLSQGQRIDLGEIDGSAPIFANVGTLIIGGQTIVKGTDLTDYLVFLAPDNTELTGVIYSEDNIWVSIPEPATATLSLLALAALAARRRRR